MPDVATPPQLSHCCHSDHEPFSGINQGVGAFCVRGQRSLRVLGQFRFQRNCGLAEKEENYYCDRVSERRARTMLTPRITC